MQPLSPEAMTDAVLSASRALVAVAARSLAGTSTEVTLPQFRVLVVLCSRGPCGMSDLADELQASKSTATRLCDRLVDKGLVERHHREADRREVEVHATPSGSRLVHTVTARRRKELDRILAKVPVAKRQPMVDALHAFAEAAGEVPDQAWALGWPV